MLHSHGHSLQQMKQRPQNAHKRHGCVTSTKHFAFRNSETYIFVRLLSKQCHDMLDFKTKLNGTKLNGTMIPVVFFVHCSCISMKTSHIFFGPIHHIDPLHRKQTLTLSQCILSLRPRLSPGKRYLITSTTSCTNLLHTRTIQCKECVVRSLRPRLLRLTSKNHCRIDMQTEQ